MYTERDQHIERSDRSGIDSYVSRSYTCNDAAYNINPPTCHENMNFFARSNAEPCHTFSKFND